MNRYFEPIMKVDPAFKKSLPDGRPFGWCSQDNIDMFKKYCSKETNIIIDGGSFLGLSSFEFYKTAWNATIICIDHWKGSEEHFRREDTKDIVPYLWEIFCANMYDYRDQIGCLRCGSVEGMLYLVQENIQPDVVYIDWSHDYDSVLVDSVVAITAFPKAVIIWDDWKQESVRKAVLLAVERCGNGRSLIDNRHCAVLEVLK